MKTFTNILRNGFSQLLQIAIVMLIIITVGCKKDDSEELALIEDTIPEVSETENESPSAPALNFPAQNENLVALLPMFAWERAVDPESDPLNYNLFLGTAGNSLELIASNLTTTDFVLDTPLEKGISYQWRVDVNDNKGNTKSSEINTFETEFSVITQLNENAPFSKRKNTALTVFNNKIWLIGGEDEAGDVLSEIWSTEDGINWVLETNNAAFGPRKSAAVIEFQNKLWIYNGSDGIFLNREIWSSEDGINWIQETSDHPFGNLPFLSQNLTTMFTFDNKIWRFSGFDGSTGDLTPERYVWNSDDGKNWVLITENHGFDNKSGMKIVPFQGKLIGLESILSSNTSKVRQSSNATDWEILSDDTLPFNIGFFPDAVIHNDKLFLTAGTGYNELWFTSDGLNWTKAVNERNYPIKTHNTSIVFNGKIYIIGSTSNTVSNDVWVID